ncbi:S1C family serine protease [Akkermansiaceae bacterium]|nr:S1C family serine protease [Akkermansiaceae bacterium]
MKRLIIALLLSFTFMLTAEPPIESLEDLKAIEKKVQSVVVQATPATVSLLSNRVGSSGSGVVVSKEGLILTAAHVIEGSREMIVIFPDGREARAKVLGANYNRDAAMVQLVGEGPWPFVELGDSSVMKTGDLVVALGHPKGYDPTRRPPVRFGRMMMRGDFGFITTDCTVIAGDSGGPLFNLEGELVGIHSHIDPREKKINNHAEISGFLRSWDKMLGRKAWGRLGADHRSETHPVIGLLLEAIDAKGPGIKVIGVPRNSPALEAGVRDGDLIKEIAGHEVSSFSALGDALIDYEAGDQVDVVVQRSGAEITLKIKLASRQEIFRRARR